MQGMPDPTVAALRDAARRQGWSVRRLARCAGLSHSTVSRLWRGKLNPSARVLRTLEACLTEPGQRIGTQGAAERRPSGAEPQGKRGIAGLLPRGVTPGELLSALDALTTLAGGPEVQTMVRVGFEAKREQLDKAGLGGPMLSRLDRLYRLYVGADAVESPQLPPGMKARIGACLLYFVLSADRVPDEVLPFGYLDDAWIVERVTHELDMAGLRMDGRENGAQPSKHP